MIVRQFCVIENGFSDQLRQQHAHALGGEEEEVGPVGVEEVGVGYQAY